MTARRARSTPRPLAWTLLFALLVVPRALLAQDDPTPFWMAEPPAKEAPAHSAKKSKPAKPAPRPRDDSDEPIAPAPRRTKPHASRDPGVIDEPDAPAPKKSAKPSSPAPAPRPVQESAASKRKKAPPAEADDIPELPPQKKKSRYEPLPPLPHLEPDEPGTQSALPPAQPSRPVYPQPAPQPYPQAQQPYAPTPQPARTPAPQTYPPAYQPGYPQTSRPPAQTAPQRTYPPPAQAPQAAPPVYSQPAPSNYPPAYPPYRAPIAPAPQQSAPTVVPMDERGSANARPDSPSQTPSYDSGASDDQPAAPRLRRFSLEAVGGVWDKATSDGTSRDWQIAYGLDAGFAFFRWLQLDVRAVRSSGTDGNSYVNATTSHSMFDGRLIGVANFGKFAAFAGVGGGMVLEKTQLFLQDVNSSQPSTLSSSGLEGVGEAVLGVRVRPWRGLTVRAEADGLLRQGNYELLILVGAGWAF